MLFFLFGTKLIRNSATLKICCHGSRSVARSIDRCRSRPQHARTDALMNTMSTTPRPDHRTARRSGPWHARPNQGPFFLCYRPLRTLVSCHRAGQKNPRTENRTEVTENRYRRNRNRRSSVPVRFHDLRNRSFSGYSVLGLGSPEELKFSPLGPSKIRPK